MKTVLPWSTQLLGWELRTWNWSTKEGLPVLRRWLTCVSWTRQHRRLLLRLYRRLRWRHLANAAWIVAASTTDTAMSLRTRQPATDLTFSLRSLVDQRLWLGGAPSGFQTVHIWLVCVSGHVVYSSQLAYWQLVFLHEFTDCSCRTYALGFLNELTHQIRHIRLHRIQVISHFNTFNTFNSFNRFSIFSGFSSFNTFCSLTHHVDQAVVAQHSYNRKS